MQARRCETRCAGRWAARRWRPCRRGRGYGCAGWVRPEDLLGLTALRLLDLSRNALSSGPGEALDMLPNLRVLRLGGNGVAALPESLGARPLLSELRLPGNGLSEVPAGCEAVLAGAKIIDWQPKRAREWADACVAEYERLFPLAKIVEAQLHSRESQWHVHVLAQPRGIDHKGHLRCSKNAMLRQGAHIATGRELPIGGMAYQPVHRSDCSAMQDAFHAACGKPFGPGRGEPGSGKPRTRRPMMPSEHGQPPKNWPNCLGAKASPSG